MADRLLPKRDWPSCYPGEVLAEEFVTPYGLSAHRLAKQFLIPRTRIERTSKCKPGSQQTRLSALARYFDASEEFWLRLQARHDVERRAPRARPR